MTPASPARTCFWRSRGFTDCDGRLDPAHWIPQQRIKRAGLDRGWSEAELEAALNDERIIVPMCRHHHSAFDGRFIRLRLEDFPPGVGQWAAQYGFFWAGPAKGFLASRLEGASLPPTEEAA